MRTSIFVGDISEVTADAICTSTNPRLSLMMGTGAAVRGRGGYQILRACESIVRREGLLPPGSAWATTAGSLDSKVVIHCVASDVRHRSSEATVASCVRNALECAARAGCRTVAMPVFASGHAHVNFTLAMKTMVRTARQGPDSIENLVFVIHDDDLVPTAREILGDEVEVVRAASDEAAGGWWADDNPFG